MAMASASSLLPAARRRHVRHKFLGLCELDLMRPLRRFQYFTAKSGPYSIDVAACVFTLVVMVTLLLLTWETPESRWKIDGVPLRFEDDATNSAERQAISHGERWVAEAPALHLYKTICPD